MSMKYTVFVGFDILLSDELEPVLKAVKSYLSKNRPIELLIFSDETGKQMDFDLSGTEREVLERHKVFTKTSENKLSTVGRPRLGVVAREISLLPSQWEWLNHQQGGASATIRLLIDEKLNKIQPDKIRIKNSQEVTYRFLSSIAGNLPQFEEVIRYLYRSDKKKFIKLMEDWPQDIQQHALKLSSAAF